MYPSRSEVHSIWMYECVISRVNAMVWFKDSSRLIINHFEDIGTVDDDDDDIVEIFLTPSSKYF